MKPLKILFLHNSTGSRLYRILPPAKWMMKQGHDCRVRGLDMGMVQRTNYDDVNWADIIVLEMIYAPKLIKLLKKRNITVIYEIDDLMQQVSKNHPYYDQMNWWRTYITYRCFTLVDAISVTGEKLKEAYKYFNSNIEILPNYFDFDFWEKPYQPNTSDMIRLLWAGGNSHKDDLLFIRPVIKQILKKYPNVKFVCCGYGGTNSDDDYVKYNYGEQLFEDLPAKQYEFSLGAPMEVWPNKLASLQADIALAPVVKASFSECKSECKYGEYAINRLPSVCSKFLYKSVKHGETGFVAETENEWYNYISKLIESEQLRKQIAKNAYNWVKANWDFNQYARRWEQFYLNIYAKNHRGVTN